MVRAGARGIGDVGGVAEKGGESADAVLKVEWAGSTWRIQNKSTYERAFYLSCMLTVICSVAKRHALIEFDGKSPTRVAFALIDLRAPVVLRTI